MALFRSRNANRPIDRRSYSRTEGERALVATYLALLCFGVAVFAPCFTIHPKFGGEWPERVAKWLDTNSVEPQTFSLIGGIGHLLHDGDLLIGGVLLVFSVLFPVGKLAATLYLIQANPLLARRHAAMLSHLGKWSMLDVFVAEVVPLLQKRGLFRTAYEGTTLRDNFGLPRPPAGPRRPARHPIR